MAGAARVVVVGAGIVGATAAWQLGRRGVDVVLVESDEPGRAVMTLGEEHGHHYLLAFPGGRVVVGATREADAGFDHRVTAAGQPPLDLAPFRPDR